MVERRRTGDTIGGKEPREEPLTKKKKKSNLVIFRIIVYQVMKCSNLFYLIPGKRGENIRRTYSIFLDYVHVYAYRIY